MAALPYWRRAANIIFRGFVRTWHTGISILTLLVAVLLLASAYSDLISPTVWIVAAFLGLAFGLILIGVLLWLCFLMMSRRWHLVLFMFLVLLLCFPRIWRYCPIHIISPDPITNVLVENGEEITTPVQQFRVLTYNTRALGDAHVERVKEDLPIVDFIRESGADVVCLQEYRFSKTKGHTEEQLRDMLKKEYPYYHMLLNYGRDDLGVAFYSKWPITYKENVVDGVELNDKESQLASGNKYCWAVFYELNVRGRKVGVLNFHLMSNAISAENRKLYQKQLAHFQSDSLLRMEEGLRQLGPSFRTRTSQVATMNRYLSDRFKNRKESIPMLLCGDLNDTPSSFAYQALKGNYADTWEEAGTGLGISYHELPFLFRIDYIFHSEHFHPLDVKVRKDVDHSDHYPLMATFQLLPDEE